MTTEALPTPHLPRLNPGRPVDSNLLREHLDSFNLALGPLGPAEILRWAALTFGARAALSCPFGGPSGMVLIDLIATRSLPIDVYSIDTGLLFPETHDLAREVERRYGIEPRRFFPDLTLAEHAAASEDKPWQVDPDACCVRRKLDVPYNALHDQGMPSLGCTVCTAIPEGIDPRSGRWPGFTKTECGLHI